MDMMELEDYSLKRNQDYLMRVLNKRYWPHQYEVKNMQDAERWCYNNFKSGNWRNVGRTFAFKNGEDLSFFILSNT